ncbi:MAG: GIY-YIG nuclease family protein [Pirellulaceae bacterium]|jgi:putative endonuclease
MYFVYVLQNQESGLRYVGQTDDLQRRIGRHNQPDPTGVRFTGKQPGMWLLVYSEIYATRAEAMQRERWLKSGVGRQWLKDHLLNPGATTVE